MLKWKRINPYGDLAGQAVYEITVKLPYQHSYDVAGR
jgi:hypothetical protein